MSQLNLALLTKQERDDIDLKKRAARLIHLVKIGRMSKLSVKSELDREQNPEVHAKFKAFLNKYRVMK